MKRLITFLLAASFVFVGFLKASDMTISATGNGSTVIQGGGSGSIVIYQVTQTTYPYITFYDKMDSTSTRSPTKGSGSFGTTTNFTVGLPLSSSSTASNSCNVDLQFKSTHFPVASNISLSTGRAGFYMLWHTATNSAACVFGYANAADVTPRFAFRKGAAGNTWSFEYEDVGVNVTLAAETTAYIEIEWDTTKANGFCAGVRKDGGTFSTSNACTGSAPSASNIGLLGDGSGANGWSVNGMIDEVIVSSDSQTNLYAIRDLGYYPN